MTKKILQTSLDIIMTPSAAFASIRDSGRAWFPLAIVLAAYSLVTGYYYTAVDFNWLTEQIAAGQGMSSSEVEQMKETVSVGMMATFSIIQFIVFLIVGCVLLGAYFNVVARIQASDTGLRFGTWFALVAWSSVPLLLDVAVMVVNMGVTDVRSIMPSELNPASLGILFDTNNRWHSIASMVTAGHVWFVVNLVIGYSIWMRTSAVRAATIVLTPLMLILAIWAALVVAL